MSYRYSLSNEGIFATSTPAFFLVIAIFEVVDP
jgi:hypothetical protein